MTGQRRPDRHRHCRTGRHHPRRPAGLTHATPKPAQGPRHENAPFSRSTFQPAPGDGSPLAVVLDAQGPEATLDMQRFCHLGNLSGTTTCSRPPRRAAAWGRLPRAHLQPARRAAFASHPHWGQLPCLAAEPATSPRVPGAIVQECAGGLVRIEQSDGLLAFAAPLHAAPNPLLALVTGALGLRPQQVLAAQVLDNQAALAGWRCCCPAPNWCWACSPTTPPQDLGQDVAQWWPPRPATPAARRDRARLCRTMATRRPGHRRPQRQPGAVAHCRKAGAATTSWPRANAWAVPDACTSARTSQGQVWVTARASLHPGHWRGSDAVCRPTREPHA